MKMETKIIRKINQALQFVAAGEYEKPEIRPWQYVQMEYERVGINPPMMMPNFETIDDAQIWMCLDAEYNTRLRERTWLKAV